MRQYTSFLAVLTSIVFSIPVANATVITISGLNAQDDGAGAGSMPDEFNLSGSGVGGGSNMTIDVLPDTTSGTPRTARYTVIDVDLDGNGSFTESFSFTISFESASNIDFSNTREVMGVNDELFNPGESFSMSVDSITDSSESVRVRYDGISEVDFQSMAGADLNVTQGGITTTTTLGGGLTSIIPSGSGSIGFTNPTFTYANTGDTTVTSDALENWTMQFTTVPEPSPVAAIALLAGYGYWWQRRRVQLRMAPQNT